MERTRRSSARSRHTDRVLCLDGARGRERVEALVHPGMLDFVGGDDAVPELVTGLVNGHAVGLLTAHGRPPQCTRREERRILHAAGAAALRARVEDRDGIDNRDVRVRIRAIPAAVTLQRHRVALKWRSICSAVLCSGCRPHPHLDLGRPTSSNTCVRSRKSGLVVHAKSCTSSCV